MKALRKFVCLLFCLPILSSCGFYETQLPNDTELTSKAESNAKIISAPDDRYTVVFEENETFRIEAERKASERIDSAILTAVKLVFCHENVRCITKGYFTGSPYGGI
ncbi:MAG: hypothetical protein IJ493_00730 [Clostridia bacterium]|nr:hypothetical protein [Clostridia bacterium]